MASFDRLLLWTADRLIALLVRLGFPSIGAILRQLSSPETRHGAALWSLSTAERATATLRQRLLALQRQQRWGWRRSSDDSPEAYTVEALEKLQTVRDELEHVCLSGNLGLRPGTDLVSSASAIEVLMDISQLAHLQCFLLHAHNEVHEWKLRADLASREFNTVNILMESLEAERHESSHHSMTNQGQISTVFTLQHQFPTALSTGQAGTVHAMLRFSAHLRSNKTLFAAESLHVSMDAEAKWQWRAEGQQQQEGTAMLPAFVSMTSATKRQLRRTDSAASGTRATEQQVSSAANWAPLSRVVSRLQGLLNLGALSQQAFLVWLMSIAFAEPRAQTRRRMQQQESSECLALVPSLQLLDHVLRKQHQMQQDLGQMSEAAFLGPKASSAPGRMQNGDWNSELIEELCRAQSAS